MLNSREPRLRAAMHIQTQTSTIDIGLIDIAGANHDLRRIAASSAETL